MTQGLLFADLFKTSESPAIAFNGLEEHIVIAHPNLLFAVESLVDNELMFRFLTVGSYVKNPVVFTLKMTEI